MARSSNDDRSDSMNPNNESYWASESNRDNQLGRSDDDYAPVQRSYLRPSNTYPQIETAAYAIAIVAFNGKAKFIRFQAKTEYVGYRYCPSPEAIAITVWHAHLQWMKIVFESDIAYARIWGPNMRGLPQVIWNSPGIEEDALNDLRRSSWMTPIQRFRANAWFSNVHETARKFEAALEHQDHTGSDDFGTVTEEIEHWESKTKNPYLSD